MGDWKPASDELARWDATETAERVRAGEVSAREVVVAAVERAEAATPLNAVVTSAYEQAVAAAGIVDGPFAGVPTFIKDLFDLAGVRTGFGSRALPDYVPDTNDSFVDLTVGTGLIPLGKSSTPEFGLTGTTEPLCHLPTRNPWDLERSSGGSSGGAGALVAGRVVPIAQGSDGGGSIRIPAGVNGVVGLKPSRGRYANETGDKLPVNILVSGVLTRTVRDQALFHGSIDAVAGSPELPRVGRVRAPTERALRIGVFTENPIVATEPDVVSAVHSTADVLAGLGHEVADVEPIAGEEFVEYFLAYWGYLAFMARRLGKLTIDRRFDGSAMEPWTHGLVSYFTRRMHRFPSIIRWLREFEAGYADLMEDWDVILCPTTASAAPPIGYLAVDEPFETHLERITAFVPYTPPWNVSGAPAISLPVGMSRDGLPVGVQLGGRLGRDADLLALSLQVEEAMEFTSP